MGVNRKSLVVNVLWKLVGASQGWRREAPFPGEQRREGRRPKDEVGKRRFRQGNPAVARERFPFQVL
jgi:hypothetical protein